MTPTKGIGQSGEIVRDIKTRCCAYTITKGSRITLIARTSDQPAKKIRTVTVLAPIGTHRVKLSSIEFAE
jgi:hypothetical protein